MADTPDPQDILSPYHGLDDRAFWRSGVVDAGAYPPPDLFRPKFEIDQETPIFTAGSCFSQFMGRSLAQAGYTVIDAEPVAGIVPDDVAHRHGYRLYSARFGDIYTVRQFLQLLQEAFGTFKPADPVWEKDARFYDALRPAVTPGGLVSPDHVTEAREIHLQSVRDAVTQAGIVVFTFGLTETWQHVANGTIYPTAPGTLAGQFDPEVHGFVNFRSDAIRSDFLTLREIFRAANPDVKFLLAVSAVPLAATAGDGHVLPASIYTKSVLRAVAGELAEDFDDVDYVPSYEIIASHPAAGRLFEADMRRVKPRGVRRVMRSFLNAHAGAGAKPVKVDRPGAQRPQGAAAEEPLEEAFKK